jgi:hypothetical protein
VHGALKPSIEMRRMLVVEITSCHAVKWVFMSLARAARFGLVPRMPRRFRVQYEDALYHPTNGKG